MTRSTYSVCTMYLQGNHDLQNVSYVCTIFLQGCTNLVDLQHCLVYNIIMCMHGLCLYNFPIATQCVHNVPTR